MALSTFQTAVCGAAEALRALDWTLVARSGGLTRLYALTCRLILIKVLRAALDALQGLQIKEKAWNAAYATFF